MGYPWGEPHSHEAPFSNHYSSSSRPPGKQDRTRDGNTYSTDIPLGPTTSHFNPWHHTFRTTSSHPSWPSMASDNRSVSAIPSQTPSPTPIPHPEHDLTNGALAAAIVVPVLTLLSAIALLFFCLRRRTTNSLEGEPPVLAAAGIKEKLGSFRRRPKPPPPAPATATEPPILTSEQNNAYYTGLDTSSLGSRGDCGEYQPRASYEPPPPPYIREPSPPPPPPVMQEMRARSPFEDPQHDQSIPDGMQLASLERPDTPRSTSNQSVTSTLYSDNASVHEAREARRSIGGAQIIEAMSIASEEGARSGSDPFVSPMGSPTSAAHAGGGGYRRASDVSEMDRP